MVLVLAGGLLTAVPATAQDGSFDGYIKDAQGGVLPGASVTATSDSLLKPVVAVSDSRGYFRVVNLEPGVYTLTVELSGFSTAKREGLLARSGSTFTVDVDLRLGDLSEMLTVSGSAPIVDTRSPGTTVNVAGELLRSAPLTSRRLWSDVLDLAPAVSSRQVSGVDMGKRAYYLLGAHIFGHSFSIDGAAAAAYSDGAAYGIDLSGDAVSEVELKTGGLEAAAPNSTGVVANIITRRGTDVLHGTVGQTLQDIGWNGNNEPDGGVSTVQGVRITDVAVGGPVARGRSSFFAVLRYADLENGISRTPTDLGYLQTFKPGFTPFNNTSKSYQPYVNVTTQLSARHQLFALGQHDRSRFSTNQARSTDEVSWGGVGGSLASAKLSSSWSNRVLSQVLVSWNNKGGANAGTYRDYTGVGPSVQVHRDAFLSRGIPTGSGTLVTMNNVQSLDIRESRALLVRADLTFFGVGNGSHEIRTGIYAAPSLRYDAYSEPVNGGFVLEEVRQIDPNNPAAGLRPFHRRYVDTRNQQVVGARERDIGLYVQDSWKPTSNITLNAGVRAEFVRRFDRLFNVERQNSIDIGPRVGFAYATDDSRTVFRASYGRMHEAVNGRDAITLLGSPINSGGGATVGSVIQTSRTAVRDEYDADGDGVFDAVVLTPPSASRLYDLEFADGLHQPYIDEFIVGARRQLPGQVGVDVSVSRRYYRDRWAVVDINGIYPSGPSQPFGGFGLVDPNRGLFYQQQNNTWSPQVFTAIQAVVSKPLSDSLQFIVGFNRQWQHISGTWNPTDPARFIQPDAFPNDKEIGHIFGNDDHNHLDGRGVASGASYRPFSLRFAGQYLAPKDISLAASYVIQAGDYSGIALTRLAAPDPVFGPATVTLANGTTQPNPLATTLRFANETRGDGQIRNVTSRYLQFSVGRPFRFGGGQQALEPTLTVFNIFNNSAQTQYAAGANQLYSPNYLTGSNRHPPRSVSVRVAYRF